MIWFNLGTGAGIGVAFGLLLAFMTVMAGFSYIAWTASSKKPKRLAIARKPYQRNGRR